MTVDPRKERDDDDDAKPLTLSKTQTEKPCHTTGGEGSHSKQTQTEPHHATEAAREPGHRGEGGGRPSRDHV